MIKVDPLMPYLVSAAAIVAGLLVARFIARSRGLAAAGIVLVALTPLVPTLRIPNGFGLSSDDLLPILGLGLLGLALRASRDIAPALRPEGVLRWLLVAGLALLLAGGVVSAVANASDAAGAVRLFVRGAGRFAFLGLIAFAVGVNVRREPALRSTAANAIAVMGTVEAAFGLIAYLLPLPGKLGLEQARKATTLFGEVPGRVSGTLGISPDFTGAILMASLITTMGLALASSGTRRRWLLLASLLQLVTLGLTFARAPLALAVLGVAGLLVLARRPILVVPVLGVTAIAAIVTPLGARFLGDSNDRLALWSAAARLIADHPLTGVGPGRMLAAMRADPDRYMHTDAGLATNNAHNTILLAGAEMGLIAAAGAFLLNAALGLLALASIRDAMRDHPRAAPVMAGAIAVLGILAQGMVNNLFTVGATSVLLTLLVGTFLWPRREADPGAASVPSGLHSTPANP